MGDRGKKKKPRYYMYFISDCINCWVLYHTIIKVPWWQIRTRTPASLKTIYLPVFLFVTSQQGTVRKPNKSLGVKKASLVSI